MVCAQTSISTTDGRRLIKRLLTHWAHKFEVVNDEDHGTVAFDPDTNAEFDAGTDLLDVRLTAADLERLTQMQQVVSNHLQRMNRGAPLTITWQSAGDALLPPA